MDVGLEGAPVKIISNLGFQPTGRTTSCVVCCLAMRPAARSAGWYFLAKELKNLVIPDSIQVEGCIDCWVLVLQSDPDSLADYLPHGCQPDSALWTWHPRRFCVPAAPWRYGYCGCISVRWLWNHEGAAICACAARRLVPIWIHRFLAPFYLFAKPFSFSPMLCEIAMNDVRPKTRREASKWAWDVCFYVG